MCASVFDGAGWDVTWKEDVNCLIFCNVQLRAVSWQIRERFTDGATVSLQVNIPSW